MSKLLRSYVISKIPRETLASIEDRLGIPRTVSIEAGVYRLAELRAAGVAAPGPPGYVPEPKVKPLPTSLRLAPRVVALIDELFAAGVAESRTGVVERAAVAFDEMLADCPERKS